mmetsp:Transcript_24674/g.62462  ORF Transcript_24674/g.62462 Transcript_24674/m.62462 type:complete len:92 (+) Transcript_24674:321-596(+)
MKAKQNQSDDDISSFLIDCPLDSKVEVKGPEILFPLRDIHNARSIFLLSGGSGISPMLQVCSLFSDTHFSVQVSLFHLSYCLVVWAILISY